MGLPVTGGLLWWYWPEAHGFIFQPLSIVMIGASLACDLIYPFVLARVRATEHIFPNGTMLSGYAAAYIDRKRTRFGNPSPDVNGTSSPRRTRTGSILSKEQKAK